MFPFPPGPSLPHASAACLILCPPHTWVMFWKNQRQTYLVSTFNRFKIMIWRSCNKCNLSSFDQMHSFNRFELVIPYFRIILFLWSDTLLSMPLYILSTHDSHWFSYETLSVDAERREIRIVFDAELWPRSYCEFKIPFLLAYNLASWPFYSPFTLTEQINFFMDIQEKNVYAYERQHWSSPTQWLRSGLSPCAILSHVQSKAEPLVFKKRTSPEIKKMVIDSQIPQIRGPRIWSELTEWLALLKAHMTNEAHLNVVWRRAHLSLPSSSMWHLCLTPPSKNVVSISKNRISFAKENVMFPLRTQ